MAFAAYLLKKLRELEQFCSSCNGMLAGGTLVAAQQILTRRRADDAGFNIEQERQFPGQEHVPARMRGDDFLHQTIKLADLYSIHGCYSTRKSELPRKKVLTKNE
jgi:hypothetical protein